MGRIEGKIAIVTGSASGIGAGVADRFLAVDRGAVAARHERLESVRVDLADHDAADRNVAACIDRFGGVDILANNAGVCDYRVLDDTDDAI